MKKMPLVSVIMPAYNAEKTIAASIASVQSQSYENWELLVLDDGSRDGTVSLVSALAAEDGRIRLMKNPQNLGVARTRNRAMKESRGEYIAFLDSDDCWRREKLEKQLKIMEKSAADLSYTAYSIVNEAGQRLWEDYSVPEQLSYEDLLSQNYIGCSTVMLRRELAQSYAFSTEFYHEDYVLWLQLLRDEKKAVGLSESLLDYCYRPNSRAGNKLASAKYRWQIYRGFLKLPLGKSLRYVTKYALAGVKKYRRK